MMTPTCFRTLVLIQHTTYVLLVLGWKFGFYPSSYQHNICTSRGHGGEEKRLLGYIPFHVTCHSSYFPCTPAGALKKHQLANDAQESGGKSSSQRATSGRVRGRCYERPDRTKETLSRETLKIVLENLAGLSGHDGHIQPNKSVSRVLGTLH